jgi:hypothetical protein
MNVRFAPIALKIQSLAGCPVRCFESWRPSRKYRKLLILPSDDP